jgi:hypothetical protein
LNQKQQHKRDKEPNNGKLDCGGADHVTGDLQPEPAKERNEDSIEREHNNQKQEEMFKPPPELIYEMVVSTKLVHSSKPEPPR